LDTVTVGEGLCERDEVGSGERERVGGGWHANGLRAQLLPQPLDSQVCPPFSLVIRCSPTVGVITHNSIQAFFFSSSVELNV
jgi:hypothetical protein